MRTLKFGSSGPLDFDLERPTVAGSTEYEPFPLTGYPRVSVVVVADNGNGAATEYPSTDAASGVVVSATVTGRVTWTVPSGAWNLGVLRITQPGNPYLLYIRVYTNVIQNLWGGVPEFGGDQLAVVPG